MTAVSVTPEPGLVVEESVGAAPWRRAAARAVDLATVLFVQWALTVIHLFFFVPKLVDRFDPEPWGRAFVPTVLFVLLTFGYESLMLTRNEGRTPGKDVFRVKVAGRGGVRPIRARAAVVRCLPIGAVLLVPPWWLALVVLTGFGLPVLVGSRRSLLDLISGTEVVVDPRTEEDDP